MYAQSSHFSGVTQFGRVHAAHTAIQYRPGTARARASVAEIWLAPPTQRSPRALGAQVPERIKPPIH